MGHKVVRMFYNRIWSFSELILKGHRILVAMIHRGRCSVSSSPSRPFAQHCYLMSWHTTSPVLPSTSCILARSHGLSLTSNVPRSVLPTPSVESDAVFDEIRQRWAVVSPVGSATAIVAAYGHFIIGDDFDVVARRFESRPDARALLFGVSTLAADVALVAYAACHFGGS